MAFVVETGAVVANANAYITVAFFRSWHVDRGITAAGADTGAYGQLLVEAAIVKATDYVDKRFGVSFKGWKRQNGQSLEWPRIDVFDNSGYWIDTNTIPVNLQRAIAEYAFKALSFIVLLPDPALGFTTRDSSGNIVVGQGGPLTRDRVKVGPVEEEKWFADPTKLILEGRASSAFSSMVSAINLPEYPSADEWLKQLMCFRGTTVTLERA